MMSKLTVSVFALVLSLALMSQPGEGKALASDAATADKTNLVSNQNKLMQQVGEQQRDEMIDALLMHRLLKELINQEDEDDDDDSSDDAELEPVFYKRGIEKRFPKWRTGDTRSRMPQIDWNDFSSPRAQHGDYSHHLRRLWEKNMVEKNKMYQNMQNLHGKRN